ncbi:hypothetical protein T484DRAFT_1756653 [Baffinella frigidus]|nr:hypothetical protein T484DRAFT_1756653 [Cryptophyta sp. CCMP2293]
MVSFAKEPTRSMSLVFVCLLLDVGSSSPVLRNSYPHNVSTPSLHVNASSINTTSTTTSTRQVESSRDGTVTHKAGDIVSALHYLLRPSVKHRAVRPQIMLRRLLEEADSVVAPVKVFSQLRVGSDSSVDKTEDVQVEQLFHTNNVGLLSVDGVHHAPFSKTKWLSNSTVPGMYITENDNPETVVHPKMGAPPVR